MEPVAVLGAESVSPQLADAIERCEGQVGETEIQRRALLAADCAIFALHGGAQKSALRLFEEWRTVASSISIGGGAERSATSLVGSESDKMFKGEPHEQVIISIYQGLLFLSLHEYGNAHASFLQAALADSFAEHSQDRGNWLTVDLLQLVSKRLMHDPQASEFAQRIRDRYQVVINDYGDFLRPIDQPLIVLLASGRGPKKTLENVGSKSESLRYEPVGTRISSIAVLNDGSESKIISLLRADDVYLQATSRGHRQMDSILHGKARSRRIIEGTGTVVNTTFQLAGAVVPGAGIVGILLFEAAMRASGGVDSSADLRQVHASPAAFDIGIFDRNEFQHRVILQALDGEDVITETSVDISARPPGPVVVIALAPY